MVGLVEHLERFLGPIDVGWSKDADGRVMPFQIVRFDGTDGVAFSTLGLSKFGLRSATSGRSIHHELLMLVPKALKEGPIPALLQQAATGALEAGGAVLRGNVIGPYGPLLPGSAMEALYAAMPAYFPDDFASCSEDGRRVAIAWLVPISAVEAKYVETHGWDAFEDRLAESDPDLTDFYRDSSALGCHCCEIRE